MSEELKQELEKVLAKSIPELNQSQIDFLRARRSYLNKEQLTKFASLFRGLPKTGKPVDLSNEDIKQNEVVTPEVKPDEVTAQKSVTSISDEAPKAKTIADEALKYDPDYKG